MKILNRLLALLLALALALSLTGCGAVEEMLDAIAREESGDASDYGDAGDGETASDPTEVPEQTADQLTLGRSLRGTPEELCTIEGDLISALAVSQGLSYGFDNETGTYYLMNSFVARKTTALYIDLKEPVNVDTTGQTMYMTVEKDGEEIAYLAPTNSGEQTRVKFMPRSISECGGWTAGEYTLTGVVGDNTVTRTVWFNESKGLKILAVPVIANYNGDVAQPDDTWKTSQWFTTAVYPVADNGLNYELGAPLDLSGSEYDLATDEGMYNVWYELASLQTSTSGYDLILGFECFAAGEDGSCMGFTYGAPANIIYTEAADMPATIAHEIAHCYMIGDEYPGGSFNVAVNDVPYKMEGHGMTSETYEQTIVGENRNVVGGMDLGQNCCGVVIAPEQYPDNFYGSLIENPTTYMGWSASDMSELWYSSEQWEQLYKVLVCAQNANETVDVGYGSGSSGSAGGTEDYDDSDDTASQPSDSCSTLLTCPLCYESSDFSDYTFYAWCEDCGTCTLLPADCEDTTIECGSCGAEVTLDGDHVYFNCPACDELCMSVTEYEEQCSSQYVGKTAGDVRALDVSFTVTKDGEVTADPWYAYEASMNDVRPSKNGAYSVVMLDENGKQVSATAFDVSFIGQSNPPTELDKKTVFLTMPFPESAQTIRILNGENVLFEREVSASVPEVAFDEPVAEDTISGQLTLNWQGTDADGDALRYEVWYIPSEEDAYVLGTNLADTSLTVNMDEYPGSETGWFCIFATDGVNTGWNYTDDLSVEYKAPEVLSSQSDVGGPYDPTDEIIFEVNVYDMQDGWLDDTITWYDENGEEFLTGDWLWIYPYELSAGSHEFRMTATNSAGMTSEATFTVEITDDESALPDTDSRQDIKTALSWGFTLPLDDVNANLTRAQLAKCLMNLYLYLMPENGQLPEYIEGVVTDCGEDDYEQFFAVSMSLMQATESKFNPYGSVTQSEALETLYQAASMAAPETFPAVDGVDAAADMLSEAGFIDDFDASANMTRELAFVWFGRVVDWYYAE